MRVLFLISLFLSLNIVYCRVVREGEKWKMDKYDHFKIECKSGQLPFHLRFGGGVTRVDILSAKVHELTCLGDEKCMGYCYCRDKTNFYKCRGYQLLQGYHYNKKIELKCRVPDYIREIDCYKEAGYNPYEVRCSKSQYFH